MTQVNRNIVEDVLSLPMNERIEPVEKLLECLDSPDAELNAIWARELDARIEAYEKAQLTSNPPHRSTKQIQINKAFLSLRNRLNQPVLHLF